MIEILQRLTQIEALLKTHANLLKKLTNYEHRVNLLNSPEWPSAVAPDLICDANSEQDKLNRAKDIIDIMIDTELTNTSFLDFGCGEGHMIYQANKNSPKKAVGYDIVKHPSWNILNLTTNWDYVKQNAPYDNILAYDVLDHIDESKNIPEILKMIRSVMSPTGKLYVRCHPWCSRHGTHLYHQINKAYIHLIFDDEELNSMGYKTMNVRKIIHPLETYSKWFKDSGLKITFNHVTRDQVEPFFLENQLIVGLIKEKWRSSADKEHRNEMKMPVFQMEQQFVDYTLTQVADAS